MKKLLTLFLLCCPFLMANAVPQGKQTAQKAEKTVTITKKTAVKKEQVKKTESLKKGSADKKTKKATKDAKKLDKKQVKQAEQKKGANKNTADKKMVDKAKKQKSPLTKNAVENQVEKTTTKLTKAVPAIATPKESKAVIVPQCQDSNVMNVLSDAFSHQGYATRTPMIVKSVRQIRETQFYAAKGIRSCYANVETTGVRYATDYSIILNDKGFFVQVENARAY